MSIRKLKTQILFSNTMNPNSIPGGIRYTQIGIQCPQQDAIIVGADAFSDTRWEIISLHVVKTSAFLNGELGYFLKEEEYVPLGRHLIFIPSVETVLDIDDIVMANFRYHQPGDNVGLHVAFRRE